MPQHHFTTDDEWNAGIDGKTESGYRLLAYSGDLGGGTLLVKSRFDGGIVVPLSDAKLDETMVDDNGDPIQQFSFESAGTIIVELDGATAPDVMVVIY